MHTDCRHPITKLTLRRLHQLGKCYDFYFTGGRGVGGTEALNREVIYLRFYAAELEK